VIAYEFPILSVFWVMLEFAALFIWIYLLIVVFADIFRSHDMGGWAKAGWTLVVLFLPLLGVLLYLIVRGSRMHARAVEEAEEQKADFDRYVRETAGSGRSSVDDLAKLAQLRDRGDISDTEFEKGKAKILADAS